MIHMIHIYTIYTMCTYTDIHIKSMKTTLNLKPTGSST